MLFICIYRILNVIYIYVFHVYISEYVQTNNNNIICRFVYVNILWSETF